MREHSEKEILRALERCGEGNLCKGCPFYVDYAGCLDQLTQEAADLLKEYQKTVFELKKKKTAEQAEQPSSAEREVPATDVVAVVRCRDCKYRKTEDCAMYCECDCGERDSWETSSDFCSWGKRKEK